MSSKEEQDRTSAFPLRVTVENNPNYAGEFSEGEGFAEPMVLELTNIFLMGEDSAFEADECSVVEVRCGVDTEDIAMMLTSVKDAEDIIGTARRWMKCCDKGESDCDEDEDIS